MCPAWSPCEHQLTLALSPIWGPASEATPSAGGYLQSSQEAIYSLNDSCSYFTQCLFPPKLPRQHTCTIFSIHSPSFILIIQHIQAIFTSFYYETITPSLLQFLLAGRLLSVFYVRYSNYYFFQRWIYLGIEQIFPVGIKYEFRVSMSSQSFDLGESIPPLNLILWYQ